MPTFAAAFKVTGEFGNMHLCDRQFRNRKLLGLARRGGLSTLGRLELVTRPAHIQLGSATLVLVLQSNRISFVG